MKTEYEPKPLNGQTIFLVRGEADLCAVVGLERVSFHGNGEDIYTLAMIAEAGWIFATRNERNELTGAIEVVRMKDPEEAFVHGICIRGEDRDKGIGARLMQETLKYLEENYGFRRFFATVSPENGPSLSILLNKNGFMGIQYRPKCYGPGEDRLIVCREEPPVFLENEPQFVLDTNTEDLADFVNRHGYKVTGVQRPENPNDNNFLILRR